MKNTTQLTNLHNFHHLFHVFQLLLSVFESLLIVCLNLCQRFLQKNTVGHDIKNNLHQYHTHTKTQKGGAL